MSPEKKEFLQKAINLSWYIAQEVADKTMFFHGEEQMVSSTLILADILEKSDWGAHPLAQERYPDLKKGKTCNNLTLLETDKAWDAGIAVYEGKNFKNFQDWGAFATHLSDMISFRPTVLKVYFYDPTKWYDREIIQKFNLGVYEYWLNRIMPQIV